MKRFFIKSVACISIAFFLAAILPSGFQYTKASAATTEENIKTIKDGCKFRFDQNTCQKQILEAAKDTNAVNLLIDEAATKMASGDKNGAGEIRSSLSYARIPTTEIDKLTKQKVDQKLTESKLSVINSYTKKESLLRERAEILKNTDPKEAERLLLLADEAKLEKEKILKELDGALGVLEQANNCDPINIACNWKWLFTKVIWPGGLQGKTVEVANMVLTLISDWLAVILGFCASVLDSAISFTMQIGKQTVLLDTLKQVWVILRDTFNIFFIFILLYIAIQTILKGSAAKTKQMLANVVIAALLINFSLMITNVVIDTSNIFANALYNQTQSGEKVTLSTQMMQSLKLQSMSTEPLPKASSGLFARTMIQIVLYSVTIWALIQGIVLMLTRTIVFLILMALSPIGFMGEVIPKIDEQSKKWRSALLDQALVGPVFIFFLLLISKLINGGLMGAIDTVSKATSGQQLGGAAAVILNVFIIVGFFITAVKVTKKLSGDAGAFLSNAAGSLAGALTVGAGGMLMRNTIGRGAASLMKNDKFQKFAGNSPVGRLALLGTNKVAKSSFDVRNTELGKTLDKQGLNLGKAGGKDGFEGQAKRSSDRNIEMAKLLKRDPSNIKDSELMDMALEKKKKEHDAAISADNQMIHSTNNDKNALTKKNQDLDAKIAGIDAAISGPMPAGMSNKMWQVEQNKLRNDRMKSIAERTENYKKIKEKEKEMVRREAERAQKIAKKAAGFTHADLNESDLEEKKMEALRKEAETTYVSSYADTVDKSVISWGAAGSRGQKAAAAKVRKDVVKAKSEGEQFAELAKKMIEKQEKEKNKTP
jgi:hypothetical protein